MAAEREHGGWALTCDGCPSEYLEGSGTLQELVDEAREEGWEVLKVGSDFRHLCPGCREREASMPEPPIPDTFDW